MNAIPHTALRALLLIVLALAIPAQAAAQDDKAAAEEAKEEAPMHVKESNAALERAREAYNDEKYEQAASLFLLASQIDPGAEHHKGTPYRNAARCHFWLGQYDKAVYWYDVYLRGWPDATDKADIKDERASANDRRNSPSQAPGPADIYDRSLLELVDTLKLRLESGAPAYTADGGGTTRLYRRAIELGYSDPVLSQWSATLRSKLLDELQTRWKPRQSSPLPDISPNAEGLDVSRGRLANLRSLAPRSSQMDLVVAYQRFLNAWGEYFNEKYEDAAESFLDAAQVMPGMTYLPYASALAHLRSGNPEAAVATLQSAVPGAPDAMKPYYDLLRAEALMLLGRHKDAAQLYLERGR